MAGTVWIVFTMLTMLTRIMAIKIKECNQTIDVRASGQLDPNSKLTFKHDPSLVPTTDEPFYCWYRLHGSESQYVIIDVRALVAGKFESDHCEQGYLRIADDNINKDDRQWLPPTTICGNYPLNNIRVKRLTRGASAFVEFHVDKAERSQSYEFDAMFVDKEPQESLPYGHIQRTDGRINSTLCDWLVPVDTCLGGCKLVSPGYPGIYPPNITCRYTLINFEHARVQVSFGGKHGKFDIKRSDDCTDDFLVIYDGRSADSVLIGRYCGLDSEFVISSGNSLYLEFHSQSGGPPYDYSGFELNVVDRWKNEHDFGTKAAGTICDWTFTSHDSRDGDLHTPDHMISSGTSCLYTFKGEPGEILEVKVKAYELKPDCQEFLEVYDGDKLLDQICADRIKSRVRGTTFKFVSSTNIVSVKYKITERRVSNYRPVWIYYTFRNSSDYTAISEAVPAHDQMETGQEFTTGKAMTSSESNLLIWFNLLATWYVASG